MMIGPMKKKMITVGIVSFVLPTVLFVVFFGMYSKKQNAEIAKLKEETAVVMRYVFSGDMPVDHIITSNDIKMVGVKEISAPVDSYQNEVRSDSNIDQILASPIGRKLKVAAFDRTIVTESMFYQEKDKIASDARVKEFNMITLPSDLQQGDYVDIRMLFPTGEDFLVLAGKEIKKLGSNADSNAIFLELNEEEMVKLSGAIIESYIANSVKLYAVKYVNNYQQLVDKEPVNYVEKYETALEEMISGDYEIAYAEAVQNMDPLRDESGEIIRDEFGLPLMADVDVTKKTADDYEIEEIAARAGISVEIAQIIKTAIASGDQPVLTYYSNQTIETPKVLVANYPIRSEIYELIQSNPNILEVLKAKYNIEELVVQRENLINTSIHKLDEYTGEMVEDTSALSSIASKLQSEIELQKTERKEFLQNMIRNNIAAGL